MARVVFRDARIYLIQWLTKIRHILSQRQSLNTDKEHLRKIARAMFWLMLLIISAKMAYSLWRYFSFSAEYTAVSSSANKPLRADAKPFDKNDVQLVSQQNWFGKYQPVAAPVKQPESAPVAETRLNVVLRDKEHLRKIARAMFWLMLLIISAKMAYSLWRYFSFSAEYTAVSSSANRPLRADAKPFDKNDVQLVSQQNWFGKYQPVAAPVKQPESEPVAETRLNVVLRGIAFVARPGAVIEEGGKQQVYLQGERLDSHNAVIEEINRYHVMLSYQVKMERPTM